MTSRWQALESTASIKVWRRSSAIIATVGVAVSLRTQDATKTLTIPLADGLETLPALLLTLEVGGVALSRGLTTHVDKIA